MINIVESLNQEQGYIYIIKVFDYYKIGKTQNPNGRFGEYTKLMQEPEVVILKRVCNYHNVEIELHNMYEHKHSRGEWYSLTENDIYDIQWYLEFFDVSTMKHLMSTMIHDLLVAQIENHFNGLIEVNINDNDEYYLTLRAGKKLVTKIPICRVNSITLEFGNILKTFSERREMINESIQRAKEIKSEQAS